MYLRFLTAMAIMALSASLACAQDESVPLGDLARAVRKSKPAGEPEVIDNDNFNTVMDKAESARLKGEPIFSIGNSGKTFTAVSLDGTCSLSFDARTIQRMRVPYIATDLPAEELLRLDGPAAIENGVLAVSLHNGTRWQLKEITVAIARLEARKDSAENAAENDTAQPADGATVAKRLPDRTLLYHLKGSGGPDSTTVFDVPLDPSSSQLSDWRWAIVAARGIPPAADSRREPPLEVSAPTPVTGAASSAPALASGEQRPAADGESSPTPASPDPQR
jgi:hypothetical protein